MKLKLIIALAAALALVGGPSLLAASAAPSEPVPVCEKVAVQENSGNGPNYTIRLCGTTSLPVKSITIDGGPLPEKTESTFLPVAFWSAR